MTYLADYLKGLAGTERREVFDAGWSKVQNWARSFGGLLPPAGLMNTPPTISRSNYSTLTTSTFTANLTNGSPTITVTAGSGIEVGQAVSGMGIPGGTTIQALGTGTGGTGTYTLSANATATNTGVTVTYPTSAGNCSVPWNDARLTLLGGLIELGNRGGTQNTVTQLDNNKIFGGNARYCFETDAPAFELVTGYNQNTLVGLLVDGQFAFPQSPVYETQTSERYLKFDFGADAIGYYLMGVSAASGGTGYVLGEEIPLTGGTSSTAAIVKVTGVSAGVVTAVQLVNSGVYSVRQAGVISAGTAPSGGTGLTLNPTWGSTHTTRKMRQIEVLVWGQLSVRGINVDVLSTVQKWDPSLSLPKVYIVGGSSTEGVLMKAAGQQLAVRMTQRIGLYGNMFLSGKAGTGWTKDAFGQARWSSTQRIADVIAAAPDVLLFIGSPNDDGQSGVAAAVTATLNTIRTSLPNVLIIVTGTTLSGAISADIKAGAEAADFYGTRVKYLDTVNPAMMTGTGTITSPAGNGNKDMYLSSDAIHCALDGGNYQADTLAPRVASLLIEMAA